MVRRQGSATDGETERLVRAAAAGEQRAWDQLVERYAGLVWAVTRGYRLGDSDAAEVAQTTWVRLVEHLAEIRTPAHVGAWLATTARRECLRVLRQAALCEPSDEVLELDADEDEIDADLLEAERDAALWRAFSRLPARDQALLRLLTADPVPSYAEIGAALGMSIGSIGPTRARSLQRLRREMHCAGLMSDLSS